MKRVALFVLALAGLVATEGCGGSTQDYIGQGNKFYEAGKYEDAALQYRRALQKDPNSGEAYYRLALTQLQSKNGTEALRSLQRATDLMPGDERPAVALADVSLAAYLKDPLHSQSFYDTIAKVANQLTTKDASSFQGLRLKGALAMIDRKPGEAIEFYRKANQRQPMNPDVVIGLVQALFQENQSEEAEKLAYELIAKEKTFGAIYNVLYEYYWASRQPAKAEEILKTKTANMPTDAAAALQLAGHYVRTQRPAEMTATLQKLSGDPKSYPLGRLFAGDFYRDIGKVQDAMRLYEEGAKADKDNKHTYQRRMAGLLLAQGKRTEGVALLDQILKENPKETEARTARATLALQDGRLESAITEFQALVKENPGNADIHLRLGQALYRQGDLEEARKAVGKSLSIQGDSIPARMTLCEIDLALQRPDEALRAADDTLRMFPEQPRMRLLRAASLIALKRPNEARPELSSLRRLFPNDPELRLQFGLLALQDKKFTEAEAIFRGLQSPTGTDLRATLGLVQTYAQQNQLDKMIQILDGELKKTPEVVLLRSLLADAATRAGKREMAQAQYEAMLAKTPDSPELLVRLGNFYLEGGDFQNALRTLEKAHQLAPKSAAPLISMALTMEKAGKPADAQTYYRQAIAAEPDQPVALNNLAYLLAETGGDLNEALKLIQRALQKMPEEPGLLDTQAWIYLKKQMPDAALQTLNVLARKHPEVSTIHYHLGAALAQKGDKQKAKVALQTALGKSPSEEEARKIKTLLAGLSS